MEENMSITCAIRRDKDKIKFKKQDFYQTPKKATEILLEHLKQYQSLDFKNTSVLDPCAGKLAITDVLCKYFDKDMVTYFDLFPQDKSIPVDFMEYSMQHDLIIMNPPYSQKKQFIEHGIEVANEVYAFLPNQVTNYIDFTEGFLDSDRYNGKVTVYPKMILNETLIPVQGGMTSYSWFHFTRKECDLRKYEFMYDMRKYKRKEII